MKEAELEPGVLVRVHVDGEGDGQVCRGSWFVVAGMAVAAACR